MVSAIVFASGTASGGGSGFWNLVERSRDGMLSARIVAVVSNHPDGGVKAKADILAIPFRHFVGPWTAESYRAIAEELGGEWFLLSGWLKPVRGLDSRRTINIHPAPLPGFGGRGMYGLKLHQAVLDAYRRGEISASAVCMHFVTEEYDAGPVFFRRPVRIKPDDTVETLASRVNQAEHLWQPYITDMVVRRKICWDGQNPSSLVVPAGYRRLCLCDGN